MTETQSDVRVRIGRPFGGGDRVAAEFWTNMRVAGEEVTLPGCLLLAFAPDGRCRALREYRHDEPGTINPPPEWGGASDRPRQSARAVVRAVRRRVRLLTGELEHERDRVEVAADRTGSPRSGHP